MSQEAFALLFLTPLALITLWIGWKRGGFRPLEIPPWPVPLSWGHLMGAFSIYLLVSLLAPPLLLRWLPPSSRLIGLHFCSAAFLTFLLFGYWTLLPCPVRAGIWKRGNFCWGQVQSALWAWAFSFPLVMWLNQFLEWGVLKIFHLSQLPEQLAVYFVKSSLQDPLSFFLAIVSITILAPLLEELLFRGFLQTFLRRHLGSHAAVWVAAACFALFHYAPQQQLGNIPIIGSLWFLALFLGFLYEKRGSLVSPIVLHACFNGMSLLNLYFLGDVSGAL